MPSIERKLQQSLNRLVDGVMRMVFTNKTMCVHFCKLREQHLDRQLYLNGTQISTIGETKFLCLIFYSKLSLLLSTHFHDSCYGETISDLTYNSMWCLGPDRKAELLMH